MMRARVRLLFSSYYPSQDRSIFVSVCKASDESHHQHSYTLPNMLWVAVVPSNVLQDTVALDVVVVFALQHGFVVPWLVDTLLPCVA